MSGIAVPTERPTPPKIFNLGDLILKGDAYYTSKQQQYEQDLADTAVQRAQADSAQAGINTQALYASGGSLHSSPVGAPTSGTGSMEAIVKTLGSGLRALGKETGSSPGYYSYEVTEPGPNNSVIKTIIRK